MKSIREWADHLPEPYRSQVLRNTQNDTWETLDSKIHNLPTAIGDAFSWNKSPEGQKYWIKVHTEVCANRDKYTNPINDSYEVY